MHLLGVLLVSGHTLDDILDMTAEQILICVEACESVLSLRLAMLLRPVVKGIGKLDGDDADYRPSRVDGPVSGDRLRRHGRPPRPPAPGDTEGRERYDKGREASTRMFFGAFGKGITRIKAADHATLDAAGKAKPGTG